MAKAQLYIRHKDMLKRFARKSVRAADEEAIMRKLYQELAPLVKAVVEAKYPPKDMKVLLKYGVARQDDCINLRGEDGVDHRFTFEVPQENGPLQDEARAYLPYVVSNGSCYNRFYQCSRELSEALADHANAVKDYDEAIRVKLNGYYALINNSRYYEEVLEIWPAAEAMREDIMRDRNAVTILSPEIIAAIKADNAGAEAAEAA